MAANRIREIRQARHMGMTELAFRIGRSVAGLQQYETGAVSPPLPVARLIAKALGAELDEVFPEQRDNAGSPSPAAAS